MERVSEKMRCWRIFFFLCIILGIFRSGEAFYLTEEKAKHTEDDLFAGARIQAYEERLGLESEDVFYDPISSFDMNDSAELTETIQMRKQHKKVMDERKAREQAEQIRNEELRENFEQKRNAALEKTEAQQKVVRFRQHVKIMQVVFFVLCVGIIGFLIYWEGAFTKYIK
ncbi:MAG: hypothetical protein JW938_00985 [Candidatus Omnitrophica bacterium]|nr:hypothetical protein [Candidatus Omnitrophota bacterium]